MKKKNILLLIGAIVVVVLAAVLIFALTGSPDAPKPLLHGTWKVIAETNGDTVKKPDNGFFIFTADKATEYRDGSTDAYVVSDYTYTESENARPVLEMPVFDQVYQVEVITRNYIRLHFGDASCKELIRFAEENRGAESIPRAQFEGRWELVYRGGQTIGWKTTITFVSSMMMHNLEGSGMNISDSFTFDGKCISVDAMGLKLWCYPATDEVLILVDDKTGAVWELHNLPSGN